MKLYKAIAQAVEKHSVERFMDIATKELQELKQFYPSGNGIEANFLVGHSDKDRLVFDVSYHHMNSNGYYVGYSNHLVIVVPSLLWDFEIRVTGKNKNNVKGCLCDVFNDALRQDVEWCWDSENSLVYFTLKQ